MKRFTLSLLGATLAVVVAMNASAIKTYAQVLGSAMAQTFTALTLTNTTNQLVLGTTNTVTISSTAPASSRTYTLPDAGAAANIGLFNTVPAALQNQPLVVRVTGSAYTNATNSFTTVTGLSFAVNASTNYSGVCYIIWQNTAATNDAQFQFTGPAAPTAFRSSHYHNTSNAATGVFAHANLTAFSSAYNPNATLAASGVDYMDTIAFTLVNGTNAGTVALQMADNTNTQTIQVEIGSYCLVQ